MDKAWIGLTLVVATCGLANFPAAAQCVKQSPAHAVALIELYTSEGCSSCPPADRWLSHIERDGYNVDELIPLSLHVDYWDQLGWKDRFASARFTERQRVLANLSRSRVVYTPEVFLNSRELRNWDSAAEVRQAVKKINAMPAMADIRLELDLASPSQVPIKARFTLKSGAAGRQPQAYVALYESKLITDVKAGENRNVSLHHDYVVREWLGPIELTGGAAEYGKKLALDRAWNPKNLGVVAFIQDPGSGEVLQATALPFCRGPNG
ncbi:MAG: DUF1223 domain-containing protein [Burkholderiales bacterium]